jgi:hypothetical protein
VTTADNLITEITTLLGTLPDPGYAGEVKPPRAFEAYAFARVARGLLGREPRAWQLEPDHGYRFRQNNGVIWSREFTRLRHRDIDKELHQSVKVLGSSGVGLELDLVMIRNAERYRATMTLPAFGSVHFAADCKWYDESGVVGHSDARELVGAALEIGAIGMPPGFSWRADPVPVMCLAAHGDIHPDAAALLASRGQASVGHLDATAAAWFFW